MLARLLVHRCDVARNQPVGTNGRKELAPVATDLPCLFLPLDRQAAIENGYSVGYAWDVYFDDGTDIQKGDRLTFNGRKYIVGGDRPFEHIPIVGHLHVIATTEDSNGQ